MSLATAVAVTSTSSSTAEGSLRRDLSNEKHLGYLLYIGDDATQLNGDDFINHDIRIPFNQPSTIKSGRGFTGFQLPETNSLHLKNDGWETTFLFRAYVWMISASPIARWSRGKRTQVAGYTNHL